MIRSQTCINAMPAHESAQHVLRQLFAPLPMDQLTTAERNAFGSSNWIARNAAKGSSIVGQDEDRGLVFVLLSGWAFRYQILPDGKRQILDFVLPGALLGFGTGNRNWYGVETVTDCRVASLEETQFKRLLAVCPAVAIRVVERLSEGERLAHEHMTSLGRRSARERIAAFIVELAERTGATKLSQNSSVLELPVTQMMIADALGLTNETVCRTLGKLAAGGLIEAGRNWLQLLDVGGLAREAGAGNDSASGSEHRMLAAA